MGQLAETLAAQEPAIVQRWLEAVRRHLASGGESRAELIDHLPTFLQQLTAVLRGEATADRTSPAAGSNPVGRAHGAQRFRLGFSLSQLVREYGLLRGVLLDVIEETDTRVTLKEVRLLTDFVATAIAEAVEEHSRQGTALQVQVQRSESWLTTVLRSIGDAVIVTDAEGRAVFLNPVAETLTGWTQAQAQGEPLSRVFPLLDEGTLAEVESPLRRVLSDGQSRNLAGPTLLVRKDGTRVPIDDSMAVLRDAAGAMSGVVLVFRDVSDTRRQRAERERLLQETERLRLLAEGERARLHALIQQAPAAIAVLRGPELIFETVNRETCRVWDRPREQFEGKPLREALPELRGQGFDVLLRGVMDSGIPHIGTEIPLSVQRPDGTRDMSYFNLVYSPWRSESEATSGVISLAMNVTEAVLARQAVQAERERAERARTAMLDALAEQNLVAVNYLRGPEHVFERANPRYVQMVDREVLGQPFLQALPELAAQGIGALLDETFQTGTPRILREQPLQVHSRDGTPRERLYDFVLQPVRDAEGRVEGILNLAIDATEHVHARRAAEQLAEQERARREAEARLRLLAESERARLDALFQQAPVAISVLRGPRFIVELANPRMLHLWGRTVEQVMGQPVLDALYELKGYGLDELLTGVLDSGEPFVATEMELQFARGEGGTLETGYFNFGYMPLHDEQGHREGVFLVATEVTEQVQLRQEAQRLAEEERTRRDFEQHLIGIVSHDLRNPLSAILLGLQVLLRREELDARTRQSLVRLRSSTERAVRMVRDLLDFTQARLGGGLKMDRAPMDVHAVVRGTVEELQMTHPERELRLEQQGDGHGQCDADRVAQMMGNLVSNALKYSPGDSPVTVRSLGEAGDIRLEVHNGGDPIPTEAMARLFQPLQRAVVGTDKAGRSVGLGLYIVDQIVRAHGGDVQVSSNAREGTTFRVRLPRSG